MKKIGVVRFLGTNCDQDLFDAVISLGGKASWLWYQNNFNPEDYDAVLIPGGFSYGDYLRCGALAARMPVMNSVEDFADQGKPVLGICNGFQVLCERGLLPGALLRNESLRFIDKWVEVKPLRQEGFWGVEESIKIPIAHSEGRYFIGEEDLNKLHSNNQVWLNYSVNPNGSVSDIAGVLNKSKNVAGLMPHPERAIAEWMGGTGGLRILERLFQ